jgi:hypothetical protein
MSVTGTIAETDPNALPLAIALGWGGHFGKYI